MYQSHGWWLPDADTHFPGMLAKGIRKGHGAEYQHPARWMSLGHVKRFDVALDIGANVGLWTRDLASKFKRVIAFEPVELFRECFKANIQAGNVELREYALGNIDSHIDMIITEGNTGHTHVDPHSIGAGKIPLWRLDSLEFDRIDYIKIDCEGYEVKILQGGQQTIMRHQPVIMVEQKLHEDTGITTETVMGGVDLLKSWGAQILGQRRNDYVMGWR